MQSIIVFIIALAIVLGFGFFTRTNIEKKYIRAESNIRMKPKSKPKSVSRSKTVKTKGPHKLRNPNIRRVK